MKVSANELFSLLSSNTIKKAQESLETSSKTSTTTQNTTNAKDLIDTLLKDLSSNTKTKETVLSDLKQSDIEKQMQSTSKELKTLSNLVKADANLSKFNSTLEKLVVDIKDITPENLKSELSKSGVYLESKLVSTTTNTLPNELKESLNNLKESLTQNNSKTDALHVKQIDTLLNAKKADASFVNSLESLVKDLKNSAGVSKPIAQLESILKQDTPLKDSNVKEVLASLKQSLSSEISKNSSNLQSVDKILQNSTANKEFFQDIKSLLSNLKSSQGTNQSLPNIAAKLENLAQQSGLTESKMQNNSQLNNNDVKNLATQIKQSMGELKELLSGESVKNSSVLLQSVQNIVTTPDLFTSNLKGTISDQLQQMANLLKSELSQTDVKNSKLTQNLETVIKDQLSNKNLVPNQKLTQETSVKNQLMNDVKATLLNIKHDLTGSTTPIHKEILAQTDRLLTQIDYFQLVSLSSNTNTSYLPFSWDSLEGGQVSLKKLKENRFFCEINLSLKEYGKIDLMIMLFDDINVNISVFAEKEEFNTLVEENLVSLKQGINKLGLIPTNVKLFDANKDKKLKEDTRNFVSSTQLGSGLNIEV